MNFQRRDFLSAGAAVATMTAAGAALAQGNPPAPSEASPPLSGTLPNNEKRLRIINLRDLETEAQKVMTRYGFVLCFGRRRRRVEPARESCRIQPHCHRALSGGGTPDTSTELLGIKLPFPVISAPVGFQGS